MQFDAGVCVDLGAFDVADEDAGVAAWLNKAGRVPAWIVLMEDRQPDFFHGYNGYEPDAVVPLNRHGPRQGTWRQRDVKRLVDAFHAHDVKVLLGYWVHECKWVDERHPELLIRDATGHLWQDKVAMNADFSPLRRMHADEAADVRQGERYAEWSVRQYARLATDFGFDGLFLGDGAMGFRRHGVDWKDLRHFDYHESWLAEFVQDEAFVGHDECRLHDDAASTQARAADVHAHHWPHWVSWNTQRWTDYYRVMADGVHATGGLLAAYNCMNYDPALARLHGVDYRGIAKAGLDILVFQAYDYAWGPLGPFGELHIARKDLGTNLQSLLRTRAHVGFDTPMRIVVTVETEDEVEHWDAPVPHTLGELHTYGDAVAHHADADVWRRAADGAFIVWGNSVAADEWRLLAATFERLSQPPTPPEGGLLWAEAEPGHLVRDKAPTARAVDELYAHLDVASAVGTGAVTHAIVAARHAAAPWAARPRGPARPVRVR